MSKKERKRSNSQPFASSSSTESQSAGLGASLDGSFSSTNFTSSLNSSLV